MHEHSIDLLFVFSHSKSINTNKMSSEIGMTKLLIVTKDFTEIRLVVIKSDMVPSTNS